MRCFRLIALVALLASPVQADPKGDIQMVIGAQIAAFRAGDLEQAFGHAAPAIQSIFGTPDNFGRMVANGYPMIWRPSAFDFLDLRPAGASLLQRVRVTDGQGATHLFDYEMIAIDGIWRINGVFPVKEAVPSV